MPAQTAPRANSKAGFTLIEVLLATLITALVMVAIMGTLWSGLTGRDTVYNLSQEQSAGIAVLGLLEKDLQGIVSYNIAGKKLLLGLNKSIRGQEADTIDFITSTDSKVPLVQSEQSYRSDLSEVGYRLRSNPKKSDFLEIWRREGFFVDDKPFEGGNYSLLYDQVKSFNITYFTEPGPQAESVPEWSVEEKGKFPYSMKIEMEVELRPRVDKESASSPNAQKRTVRFERTLIFPSNLNLSLMTSIVPLVPEKAPELQGNATGAQGNNSSTSKTGTGKN